MLRAGDLALIGCEALLRWDHPTRGAQSPALFVPIMERSQLVHEVGDWVLAQAAAQVQQWCQQWSSPLRLAVNVAALQLLSPEFPARVQRALQASGLAPQRLTLEIPNELLMNHPHAAAPSLARLAALGVGIDLDDFNAGPSALSNMRAQGVNGFKLDRRFLDGISISTQEISVIAALARQLGLRTVAEGVQTETELSAVRACGIDELQGSLMCRALPAEAFEHYLRAKSSSRIELRGD